MLPDEFIQRLKGQKYIDPDILLKALEEPSPVSIRINPTKWNKTLLDAESVPWCENGFYLANRPSYTLDPLFHSGCYYPQEASGMFLEQAVLQVSESLKNVRVLDLCGAPGGKSTHLSDLIGPDSLLVANEVIRSRASILSETVTKWGSGNTLVTQNDPSVFGRLAGFFDVILVDAPCSGEGMFRTDMARNEWSVENALHCSERQKRILMDIWPALKENGVLIYSTCTFNPGENEENIRWLIDKKEAECVRLNISDFIGITEIDYQGIYGYGFYPGRISGEGFFISVLRKTGKQDYKPGRNQRISELKPAVKDMNIAKRWSDFPDDRFLKRGDELFAAPCGIDDFLHLFQNLKVVKSGTKIFVAKNNDYIPSHDLAISQHIRKDAFHFSEVDFPKAISYLRRDNLNYGNSVKGWNILTYEGINMGFIKNIGNRINNYFPVEWRIRMSMPDTGIENSIKWTQNKVF